MQFFKRKRYLFLLLCTLIDLFDRALSSSWELYENEGLPRIISYEQPDCCETEYGRMRDTADQKSLSWDDLCRDVTLWIKCLENCRDQNEELYTIIHQAYASTLLKCKNVTALNEAAECFDYYVIVEKDLCRAKKTELDAAKESMNFDDAANIDFAIFGKICSADVALKQCMENEVREGCCQDSANLIFHYFELQMTRMQQFYSLDKLPEECEAAVNYYKHAASSQVGSACPQLPRKTTAATTPVSTSITVTDDETTASTPVKPEAQKTNEDNSNNVSITYTACPILKIAALFIILKTFV